MSECKLVLLLGGRMSGKSTHLHEILERINGPISIYPERTHFKSRVVADAIVNARHLGMKCVVVMVQYLCAIPQQILEHVDEAHIFSPQKSENSIRLRAAVENVTIHCSEEILEPDSDDDDDDEISLSTNA